MVCCLPLLDTFSGIIIYFILPGDGLGLVARRQCLKSGGRLRIYFTANGLRDTTYYRLTLSEQFNLCRQEVIEYQKVIITDSELRDCETEERPMTTWRCC